MPTTFWSSSTLALSISWMPPKWFRSALLNHFGGIQEIENASVDELQKVVGINYKLATKIRESLKK